ncbi:hypothetical protein BKA70DRAFT_1575906 [Coprinopsis sp. MPI-PUGE-AT-0042]|nr:hypothetical protein BKA70DRAFT_1575906 [Coprinopsis sp. MPI-PUGE-AT-0042]
MPHTNFEEGIYTIVNSKATNLALDIVDGKAIVNQFIGCESQRWEVSKLLAFAWSIRNVGTGRYLGMNPDDEAKDWYDLGEVEHPFPWHFRAGNSHSRIRIFVPYTSHVIDIREDNGNPKAGLGTVLFSKESIDRLNQQWHLCKDLHLATSNVLRQDAVYRIVNTRSNTVVQIHHGKVSCFKLDREKDCQKFTAVETDNGWAFRSNESQDFLGLPNMVASLENAPRLSSVKKKFTWVILPHHEDTSKFKIWVPFTSRVVDLHRGVNDDDTPIHLQPERNFDCQWWRFELVDVTHPDGDAHIGGLPGAPEPRS